MEVSILGTLELRRGGDAVPVAGARVRALLARLALDAGRDLSPATLIDAVWDDEPPRDAGHALQALVSRLRRVLDPGGELVSGTAGYRLQVDPDAVDALRFETLAAAGAAALRDGDPRRAAATLRDALALWRGPALGELAATQRFATLAGSRLDDLRLAATADRIEADLALGAGGELVAELDALTAAHPLHERLAGQRLRALAAAGRPADALAAYEALRVRLDAELGAVPSPELQAVQLAIVTAAPSTTSTTSAPTTAARRSNLRAGVTSFVGREADVGRLAGLLDEHRLVTLIGPGGAGKTRLAGEVAGRRLAATADGAWMVELAATTDPGDVGASVLGALGLREARLLAASTPVGAATTAGGGDPTEHLVDVLAERETLIILDNCEHLLDAAAVLADLLLARCPALRILATSREPLGIAGEHLAQVSPLGLPPAGATADEALTHPAVRLLADRAAAAAPDFAVDDSTVAAVVEICRRLDGLPLAIELAAARLRSLSAAQIAERLDDRFRLLTGGSRVALPRQRTLRAVVDWSWDLLSEPERALARRLAVFPAGVTADSAAAVGTGAHVAADDVPELLAALVDRSLLTLVDRDQGRYRMLETIREYGIERLDEAGELAAVRTAHARHFAALVDEAEPHLRRAEQLTWFRLLQAERENVLSALRWLAETGDAAAALRLAVSSCWFWLLASSQSDAMAALRVASAVPGDADPLDRLLAEAMLGMADNDGESEEAIRDAVRELLDRLDALDLSARPVVTAAMPALAWVTGDRERADALFAAARAHPDPWVRASVPLVLAQDAENRGELAAVREHLTAALAAYRATGERWAINATLISLGGLCLLEEDLDGAGQALEDARELMAELGADGDQAMLQMRLADVRERQGELAAALHHARLARDATDLGGDESAMTAAGLARVLWSLGERDEAREVLAHAVATVDRLGRGRGPRGHADALVRGTAALIELDDDRADVARELLAGAWPAAVGTEDLPVVALVGIGVAALAHHDGDANGAAEMLGGAPARLRRPHEPPRRAAHRAAAR
ncbi:BTAD domain-containing putative transcriptional regulator [Conexibacter woesei]|uniref:BTAD domain-containing putative transcriptional regulator n=1 Tax=Conexibacter woesei TaxID=191495 RepID=UPI0004178BFB|nr:BTAD domain-containing putative transcriptional regulator [Conexibacter woesei]